MKFIKFNDLMLGNNKDYCLFIPSENAVIAMEDLRSHRLDDYVVKSICKNGTRIQIELVIKNGSK